MFSKMVLTLVTLSSLPALAQQSSLWGTGMYGGTQGCSYKQTAGAGATSDDDETKEIQQSIQELTKQKKQKTTEKSRLEKRDMRDSLATINDVLSSDYSDFVINHIDTGRNCLEYKGIGAADDTIASGDEGGTAVQAPGTEATEPFSANEWSQVCDKNKSGSVSGAVCAVKKFRNEDKGTATVEDCKKALSDYRKEKLQDDKLTRELAALDRQLKSEKDRLKDAKEDALQAKRDAQSSPSSDTEGGVCIECTMSGNGYTYQKPQTDWANVAANGVTGILATYMGYQQNKMVTKSNAELGYPTSSYPAIGYGMPYIAQALYGAMGGGTGSGSFGCGGSSGSAGGAFGYPSGMMGQNTMGGGIYTAGMGPWGMNGMNALGGMGMYGNTGMMMGSMSGSMMGGMMSSGMMMGNMMSGSMMGSMMGNSMMSSMMGGIISGGMMMGNMSGYGSMMGNMMSSGMMMGNMMNSGMMTGSMMGSMTGSMMGYGAMMNSGLMMGSMTGTMMSGSMLGGLMSSGMMSSGMMTSGMMMGSLTGSMTGSLMGYGSMSSDPSMMQYQQQAMQMQMQYYQQYQQQQMQRYQSLSSLQSEMYSLMYKMQAIQSGVSTGTTGYIGSSVGSLTSTGYSTYPIGGLTSPGYSTGTTTIGTVPVTTTINATGR